MSGDHATPPERGGEPDVPTDSGTDFRVAPSGVLSALDRDRVVIGAGVAALLAVTARTLLRVLHNLPFDPVAVPPALRTAAAGGTTVVLSLALVAVALASARSTARVGLLFAGGFGPLAVLDPAATIPAAVAAAAGGAVAVLGPLGRPTSYRAARRRAVALALVLGVALSLLHAVGLPGGSRAAGTLLALGGVAALGVRVEGDRVALLAGGLAFGAVTVAGLASPFVAGSALLVGFAVVDAPPLLVALAAAGGTAAAVAGLRRGEPAPTVGACLLLAAGVPGTVPRALAVVLGATLSLVVPGTPARAAAGEGDGDGDGDGDAGVVR